MTDPIQNSPLPDALMDNPQSAPAPGSNLEKNETTPRAETNRLEVQLKFSRAGNGQEMALIMIENFIERIAFDRLAPRHEEQLRQLIEEAIKALQDPTVWNAVMDPQAPAKARVLESTVETAGADGVLHRRPELEEIQRQMTVRDLELMEEIEKFRSGSVDQPEPLPVDVLDELMRR